MKKGVISIGVFLISILMISTATAVPTTHSKPVMDQVNRIEQQEEKLLSFDVFPQSILQLIWQILLLIINLIMKLIEVVNMVITIVQLIQALITGLQTLIQMIQNIIQLITDLFNPDPELL